jgi:hypothetical protein
MVVAVSKIGWSKCAQTGLTVSKVGSVTVDESGEIGKFVTKGNGMPIDDAAEMSELRVVDDPWYELKNAGPGADGGEEVEPGTGGNEVDPDINGDVGASLPDEVPAYCY